MKSPNFRKSSRSVFTEDQLLPISALQHWIFCPRQCGLIHLEQLWAENQLTVEGKILHEKADSQSRATRDGIRTVYSLPLRSLEWGLIGKADAVEFEGDRVTPVEYKRGRPKKDDSDKVQLCAQAICLEEMCDTQIAEGSLFYGQRKRRTVVEFDKTLRDRTIEVLSEFREMLASRITPLASREPKCDKCSLVQLCMPDAIDPTKSASRFMARQLSNHLKNNGPTTDDMDDES